MDIDLADLPDNVETLQRMVRTLATERANLTEAQAEIERLRLIVQKLQRSQFGRRAERLDDDQLQLSFEDLHADIARVEATLPSTTVKTPRSRTDRPSLPAHLPREDIRLDLEHQACPCCGGELHVIGETVSEMLDLVPARLRVIRICRPRYGCRTCGTIHQAPAPERPIGKGLASPALLAHVLVAKYCDHLPLYRQSQIFARYGVEIDRSTLANWVGGACISRTLFVRSVNTICSRSRFANEEDEMADENGRWRRQDESFQRAHHEAWKRSDLNQRQYCEAERIPLKAFGNWRALSKAEPQLPERRLLYRRRGLSPPFSPQPSPPFSPPLNPGTYPSSCSASPIVARPRNTPKARAAAPYRYPASIAELCRMSNDVPRGG
jgi:transposase